MTKPTKNSIITKKTDAHPDQDQEKLLMTQAEFNHRKTVTFTLSFATCITLGIAGFFICGWIFFMGIILGRGHYPEEQIPRLDTLMPQTSQEVPIIIVAQEQEKTDAEQIADAPQAPRQEPQKEDIPITHQELSYPEALKPKARVSSAEHVSRRRVTTSASLHANNHPDKPQKTADAAIQEKSEQKNSSAVKKDPPVKKQAARNAVSERTKRDKPNSITEKKKNEKQGKAPGKLKSQTKDAGTKHKKESPKTQSARKKQNDAQGKKQIFKYEFQVAAFKDNAQARQLEKKLKAAGMQTHVEKTQEKGTAWYKNIVLFKGTADDVDTLRGKLKQHNLHSLIRKSKTPLKARP